MALTTAGYALLSAAVSLAVAGVGLGNFPLVALASVPLFLLLAATARAAPAPRIERRLGATRLRRGQETEIEVEVELPPGLAVVEVHQPLPAEFTLESGTNLHIIACRSTESRRAAFRVRCRATRRGSYTIPPVEYEVVGLLGLEAPVRGTACGEEAIEVAPRSEGMALASTARALAVRPASDSGVSRLGARGTDYRELRNYQWGDPSKSINWKATMRRMARGASVVPLVNEYEREGKRTVFILLDASRGLEVGTSVETVLDHAIDAAQAVASHFLSRGYRVGAYAYNARQHRAAEESGVRPVEPLYPDVGVAHGARIREALASVEAGDGTEGLAAAVERCHGHLRGSPLVVVVTSLRAPGQDVVEGVERLRGVVGGSQSRALPALVVDVRPYHLLAREGPRAAEARVVLEGLDAQAARAVASAGASVLPWDPARESFAVVFLKGVRA